MQKNKANQPLKFLLGAIAILYAFSFIKIDYEILGLQLHTVDVFSDLTKEAEQTEEEIQYDEEYFEMEDDFFKTDDEKEEPSDDTSYKLNNSDYNVTYASMGIGKIFELLDDDFYFFSPSLQGKSEPIRGNTGQLKAFFRELNNSKSKQVRIAHYGDSMIEGDLITADLRQEFQRKYGGEGVGFLGITSQDTKFRQTTTQTFSNDWETAAVYSHNPNNLPVGISGEIFIPKGNSWVEFKTTQRYRTVRNFSKIRLFYSDAKASEVTYIINGSNKGTIKLKPGGGIKEAVIDAGKNATSLRLEFSREQGYFYGVSLEGGNGVYVDNFPLRGNSGVDLNSIPANVLKDFSRILDYNLIILEFGLNAAGSITSDYDWYEREMVKVIKRFQDVYPNAGIIMITAHDKSIKKGADFVTDPAVVKLLKSQMQIAKAANIALWNMFEAMGGLNSMSKWVDANPPLAFKDYIHFNGQGARKIAGMLFDAILGAK